jgi:hypothetical protein
MELNTVEKSIAYEGSVDFILKEQVDIPSVDKASRSSLYIDLLDEAGLDVVNYLESFDLLKNQSFILLSSVRHYLYGPEELKNVKVLINLKLINPTKQINYCLKTMNRVLPKKGIFVGCFLSYESYRNKIIQQKPNVFGHMVRIISFIPLITWLQYIMNPKRMHCLTIANMSKKLEKNGFKLIDVKEINGVSYFVSKKAF